MPEGTGQLGVRANPVLIAEGWERRFLADPARAREAFDTYAAAGFEVHLESLAPTDFGTACSECAETVCASYVVVYTRKRVEEPP